MIEVIHASYLLAFVPHRSKDGVHWSSPTVALAPSNAYNANSVCDPSVVEFHGVYYMYHTCINTGMYVWRQTVHIYI